MLTENIIELPEKFDGAGEVHGMKFEQLLKSPSGFLFKVKDNGKIRYEVIRRIEVNLFDWHTKTVLPQKRVKYPKAKDFGKDGWTYSIYNKALEKFNNL